MNKIVVCTYQPTYNSYRHYWDKTGLDFTYLNDATKHDLNVGLTYTEQDVREELNFDGEVSKRHYWNSYGNRNIIWFYAHFRMLYYYIKNPNYDYYWFFDDDITVSNWDIFFDSFKNNPSDFIAHYCFKDSVVELQPLIPKIDNKTTSGHLWFQRFPGDGDILYSDVTSKFGSFFPMVRLSNRSLAKLLQLAKEGLHGYSEGFVPTMLNYFGYSLDTIYNNESRAKYYSNEEVKVLHKNTVINWEWI